MNARAHTHTHKTNNQRKMANELSTNVYCMNMHGSIHIYIVIHIYIYINIDVEKQMHTLLYDATLLLNLKQNASTEALFAGAQKIRCLNASEAPCQMEG